MSDWTSSFYGAGDEARTRYLHLGKVALYQMSYTRGTKLIIARLKKMSIAFFDFCKNFFMIFMALKNPHAALCSVGREIDYSPIT